MKKLSSSSGYQPTNRTASVSNIHAPVVLRIAAALGLRQHQKLCGDRSFETMVLMRWARVVAAALVVFLMLGVLHVSPAGAATPEEIDTQKQQQKQIHAHPSYPERLGSQAVPIYPYQSGQ